MEGSPVYKEINLLNEQLERNYVLLLTVFSGRIQNECFARGLERFSYKCLKVFGFSLLRNAIGSKTRATFSSNQN